jgi:hypothetical protein
MLYMWKCTELIYLTETDGFTDSSDKNTWCQESEFTFFLREVAVSVLKLQAELSLRVMLPFL